MDTWPTRKKALYGSYMPPLACERGSEKKAQPDEEIPLPAQKTKSFSWMLANHGDQIAHFDKSRSILQI